MLYPTHAATGALAGLWLGSRAGFSLEYAGVAMLAGAVAGILPDLDHPESFAWGRVPAGRVVARAATFATAHRTFTHSFIGAAVFALLLRGLLDWTGISPGWAHALWAGAVAGWVSHALIDCVNPEGAQLLWPVGPRLSLARVLPWPLTFTTGSQIEVSVLRPALAVLLGLMALKHIPS